MFYRLFFFFTVLFGLCENVVDVPLTCLMEMSKRSTACSDIFQSHVKGIPMDDLYEGSASTEVYCKSIDDYIDCLTKPTSDKCKDVEISMMNDVVISSAKETKKDLKCDATPTVTHQSRNFATTVVLSSVLALIFNMLPHAML